MKSDPQVVMPQRAFDWSPSCVGLVLNLTSAATTMTLPLSPNSTLPEYQLTQEWFDQVVSELRELEESEAAVAAAQEGKFWEMHDLLYENQKSWSNAFDVRPIFEGYATKIGLDLEQFRRDSSSEAVAQRILLDGNRGRSLGVTGTPTVFMNGREVPFESLAPEKLRVVINNELAAKGR